jgi:two-component system, chemotaxis family, protein-glutamate methylesterase/glutaminase
MSDDESTRTRSVSGPRPWAAAASSERVVVIAASAGALGPLLALLASLPRDFPAAIAVVQHRGEKRSDLLPSLLTACTELEVCEAREGDTLRAGVVYLCPPGVHMLAEHTVRLVSGPKLEHVRPSADAMLRSVARAYGERGIGVVLSGHGSDGALGSLAVTDAGGTVLAQEPGSAAQPSMPSAAVERGRAHPLPIAELSATLLRLVGREPATAPPLPPASPARRDGKRITVLLADDHRLILDGLRTLLGAEADIEVVGEAEDGESAVKLACTLRPEVIVMDVGMPVLDGIAATKRLRTEIPDTRVVILSARSDASAARRVVEAGAIGYVCKEAAFAEVANAIRAVASGTPYFSPRVANAFGRGALRDALGR